MTCGYTLCRFNKDDKCTHEDSGAECRRISNAVLGINEDGCKFCGKDVEEREIKVENDTWMLLFKEGKWASLYHQYDDFTHFFGFSINNCPMCGRKLV